MSPYSSTSELPDQARRNLPEHAQHIYLEAYNNAWEEYKDPGERRDPGESREQVAHKVAWAAVKQEYRKNRQTGRWEKKPEDRGEEEDEEE